jgi:hypothetical protein
LPRQNQYHSLKMGAFLKAPAQDDNINLQHATPLENHDDVLDYMDKHMANTMFRDEKQMFLPQANFDTVTAKAVIRNLVSRDSELHLGQHAQEEFVQDVFVKGRKMFATCVFSEMSLTCVQALFDDGLTDARFPFKEEECPGLRSKRRFRTAFLINQSRFNSTYFTTDSEHQWDNRVAKPIDFDERSLLGSGAFGNVYEIWIHSGQRSFNSVRVHCCYQSNYTDYLGLQRKGLVRDESNTTTRDARGRFPPCDGKHTSTPTSSSMPHKLHIQLKLPYGV